MKPVGDNLFVREIDDDKTAGGLHIVRGAASAKESAPVRCEVLAIGPGEKRIYEGKVVALTCSEIMGEPVGVGEYVLCHRFYGVHRVTRADGSDYKVKIVSARDVLAVCE